jgi:hypothetical protein
MISRMVAEMLSSRDTGDGLYQAARLEGGGYALVIGGKPIQRRYVLPFNPGIDVTIELYDNLVELQRDWVACMDDIENSEIMLMRQPIISD